MTAGVYTTPNERVISGALALAMHLLFLVFLIVGVSWQQREPQPVVVDLWNDLPPLPAPKPPPAPKAKPVPTPPAPKVEVKPPPKVEPKIEPKPVPDPEIALKEKKEKERKAREQALAEKKKREQELAEKKKREKALAEKKKRERALAEKKRREEQARLKAQQAKEAEARRLAREQAEAQRKLAAAQASARAKLIDEYKYRISKRIKRFIVEPPNLRGNPEVVFAVTVLPGGEVLEVKTRRASAVAAWDSAVERAILLAQPLPLPPDPALMREFRELELVFRPKE